jgi:hypothetical protein
MHDWLEKFDLEMVETNINEVAHHKNILQIET